MPSVVDALVFADRATVIAEPLNPTRTFFADLDGDGHLDVVSADQQLHTWWYRGDGDGGFSAQDTTALDRALTAMADAADAELGIDSDRRRLSLSLEALPTAGGDRLVASIRVEDGTTLDSGMALGVLSPNGSGGWRTSLLEAVDGWGTMLALADLDGNGVGEVLMDVRGELTLFVDGDAARPEALGELPSANQAPAAWTTFFSGGVERGFVLMCNWGFGFTEAWTWTGTRGLERIADGFYTTQAVAEAPPGAEASDVWMHGGPTLFRLRVADSPASFEESVPEHWTPGHLATGNFDGSGRITAIQSVTEAVRVNEDGELDPIPLTLSDFDPTTSAADINGDGLDDLVQIDGLNGLTWMENISAP